ncbi:protein kinase domain-containing protein [Endozoicomonas sp.]|uniref:protein kinase domain-containing protein n=1 Tax=Endozoicomonas sp. TaxID=1892382 RepID=UPI003AF593D3
MNIDPNQSGYILSSDSSPVKTGETSAEVFNKRKIEIAEVGNSIPIRDFLKENGFVQDKHFTGMGAFGRVYRVTSTTGEKQFALKVKRRNPLDKSELSSFLVQNKGIPVVEAYFGVIRHKADKHIETIYSMEDFELKSKDFDLEAVALEYIDGEDFDKYLKQFDISGTPMTEDELRTHALEVCRGAMLFNENSLVHRDLKPQNLMRVERDGKVELRFIDFSTAVHVDDAKNKENDGVTGSDGYMSPEAYKINGFPDVKDDSWAVGAILCFMAFGKTPNQIFEDHVDGETGSFEKDTAGFAELSPDKKEEILLKELKIPLTPWTRDYIRCIINLTDNDTDKRATTGEAYLQLSAEPRVDDGFDEPVSFDATIEQEIPVSVLERTMSRDSGIDTPEQIVDELSFDNLPSGNLAGVGSEAENSNLEESPEEKAVIPTNAEVESDDSAEQSTEKAKSPLEMTFLERQADAANKRKDREAQYKTRAEAEKEWVEGFRGNKTKNKVDRNATKGNNQKKQ